MSRPRKAGMTRTQSGSYILNLSKQPTPAPSPSERDDDYEPAGDYGVENMDMAVDNGGEALPVSHLYTFTSLSIKIFTASGKCSGACCCNYPEIRDTELKEAYGRKLDCHLRQRDRNF